jgi:hypothetical protein
MAEPSMLDKAVKVVEELKECLTDGRALLKDLRHERKELEKMQSMFRDGVRDVTDEELDAWVERELNPKIETLGNELVAFQRQSEERIHASFDEMAHILLYGTKRKKPGQSLVHHAIRSGKAPYLQADPPIASMRDGREAADEVEENL